MTASISVPVQAETETAAVSGHKWRVFMRYIIICLEKGRCVAEFRGSERAKPSARIGIDKTLFEEFLKNFGIEKIEIDFNNAKGKEVEVDEIRIRNLIRTISDGRGRGKEKRNIRINEIYAIENDIAFELAMIYACLLRVLRKEEKRRLNRKITERLLRLHMHELTFWNHHFSRSKNRYEQDRVARAFLTLYNLR